MKSTRKERLNADGPPLPARAPVVEAAASSSPREKHRGKPTLLTPAVQRRICESIASGLFINQAAKLAGVSVDTLQSWRERGASGEEPYAAFVAAFEAAETRCEAMLIKIWKDACPDDWRAAKELAARRFPTRWSESASRAAVFADTEHIQMGAGFTIEIILPDDGYWNAQPKPVELVAPALAVEASQVPEAESGHGEQTIDLDAVLRTPTDPSKVN